MFLTRVMAVHILFIIWSMSKMWAHVESLCWETSTDLCLRCFHSRTEGCSIKPVVFYCHIIINPWISSYKCNPGVSGCTVTLTDWSCIHSLVMSYIQEGGAWQEWLSSFSWNVPTDCIREGWSHCVLFYLCWIKTALRLHLRAKHWMSFLSPCNVLVHLAIIFIFTVSSLYTWVPTCFNIPVFYGILSVTLTREWMKNDKTEN